MFTLADTETDTETNKKKIVSVHQQRFPLGAVVGDYVGLSSSASVNGP